MNRAIIFDFKDGYLYVGKELSCQPHFCIPWLAVNTPDSGYLNASFSRLRDVFHNKLNESSLNRNIVIVDDVLCSTRIKKLLCELFLNKLKCKQLVFIPSAIAECISSGSDRGLVLEIYNNRVVLTPCYDNRIIETGIIESLGSLKSKKTIEDIGLTENCFSTKTFDKLLNFDDGGHDLNEMPLVGLILKVLKQLPIDIRKSLLSNIIISHESKEVDLNSIRHHIKLLPDSAIILSLGSWTGASIFSIYAEQQKVKSEYMVTAQEYLCDNYRVPDWFENRF
ncbi:hypothetical protein TPHA_0B03280 [Tetrapisispora phaffii CBS 4417]|uniref:Uncharacterized protein n=1 Tax=Tetrapisispora phaffii (strain ATCC 24235 / CBS 4417 / NBRC 1672 / NRRL Y-8282 / UCD 70-5) TaxID=1071381 RepID=G8BPR9_TETPH|nr:hypothetical protein TPHA_0B03280 [Tetrapisispora phaffii CBS 4417]CCE62000.1 hypothetical protein TPHA_0B03280 [Tetrapisispora phaffii CBS 4417]